MRNALIDIYETDFCYDDCTAQLVLEAHVLRSGPLVTIELGTEPLANLRPGDLVEVGFDHEDEYMPMGLAEVLRVSAFRAYDIEAELLVQLNDPSVSSLPRFFELLRKQDELAQPEDPVTAISLDVRLDPKRAQAFNARMAAEQDPREALLAYLEQIDTDREEEDPPLDFGAGFGNLAGDA